jgi:hypothetical protein
MNISILLLIIIVIIIISSNNNDNILEHFGAGNFFKKLNPFKSLEKWIEKMGYYLILIICCPCITGLIVLIIYGMMKLMKK